MATVFVTVGTTKFDALIHKLDCSEFIHYLEKSNVKHLIVQIGNGSYYPVFERIGDIKVEVYRFSNEYKKDIEKASLVISHAGAGTIMDVLKLKKRLIVVVNTDLMDNHQFQLADAMAAKKYLISTTVLDILDTLNQDSLHNKQLKAYPMINDTAFPNLLLQELE